ncbi:hypothetical protein [Paludisphaera rhizosphaerae]|uniref:hypothetical protein n=1 Tax=Paludisphaera rhizosphaerae TaxID=2711216 RepID=UPI0013EA6410|nr:hypothetical protein [Paludisphaera rhizosphaerae]
MSIAAPAPAPIGHDLQAVLVDLLDTLSPGLAISYDLLIDPAGRLERVDLSAGIAGREPHRTTLRPASSVEEVVARVFTVCDLARAEIPVPEGCPF